MQLKVVGLQLEMSEPEIEWVKQGRAIATYSGIVKQSAIPARRDWEYFPKLELVEKIL